MIITLVDADSYLKWAAATLDRLAGARQHRVVIVANPTMPSEQQVRAALRSSRLGLDAITVQALDEAVAAVDAARPHAVLVAMRGPLAAVVLGRLAELPERPVLVTGIPGIALPARRKAIIYRAQADLMIVHSLAEARAYRAVAASLAVDLGIAVSTLPFLERRAAAGDDIVFAAQALLPARRRERVAVATALVDTARAHPHRRVVLKVRAVGREAQTHAERWPLPALLPPPADRPANLVVESGPMRAVLDRAGAVVSVSSTALVEAVARGIPALVLGDFGVGDAQLNGVFIGSGLIGSLDDLRAARFSVADAGWAHDNYLHPVEADDAAVQLAHLIERRRASGLPQRAPLRSSRGGALRRAWYRRTAFGRHDRSPLGALALVVGVPARAVVRAGTRLRRLVGSTRD